MSAPKKSHGFTLVEVLVVVAIVAVFASVVMFNVQSAQMKARDTERISDLEQLQLAFRLYKDSADEYPDGALDQADIQTTLDGYLSGTIGDPLNTDDFTYVYEYDSNVCSDSTILYAKNMEREESSNWADVCSGEAPGDAPYVIILK